MKNAEFTLTKHVNAPANLDCATFGKEPDADWRLFQDMAERAPVAIGARDLDGRYWFVNKAFEVLAGRPAERIIGFSDSDLWGRDAADNRRRFDRQVLETGEEVDFKEAVNRNGQRVSCRWRVYRIGGCDESASGLCTFATEEGETNGSSEQDVRHILDNLLDLFFRIGVDGRFIMVSPSIGKVLGIEPGGAVGTDAARFFDEPEALRKLFDEVERNGGKVEEFETRFVRADGETVWMSLNAQKICDDSGHFVGIEGISRDITSRKQAEAALRESEGRYRTVIDTASEGWWVVDQDLRTVDVNEALCRMLEVNRDAIVGRSPIEFAKANQKELFESQLIRSEIGDHHSFEVVLLSRSGREIEVQVNSTALRNVNHHQHGSFAFYTDITARKAAERASRENEIRYRAVFNQTYQFMGILEPNGIVVEVNQTALDFISMARETIVGKPFWEAPWWHHSAEAQQNLRKCISDAAAGRTATTRVIHLSFDGQERVVDFSVKPLRDESGRIIYLIPEGHDVTERDLAERKLQQTLDELESRVEERTCALQQEIAERQKAEAQLQKAKEELERRVEERTRDLQNQIAERQMAERQFIQAQKMEAVGHLTGGISHDFNNLLTIILGNLDWLSERVVEDEKSSHLVEEAMKAAKRGANLTQRLLAFSRRQELCPEVVELPHLLSRFEPLLSRALRERITLKWRFTEDLWPVFVDPGQFENAIINLGINARDAMPDGGQLTISAGNVTVDSGFATSRAGITPGEYVLVSVADTGTGMPPEVVRRAFDPFFTTKEAGKGSGLGLSMVFGFARQSGGFIEIDSTPEVGTDIHLYLPRADFAQDVQTVAGDGAVGLQRGSERVLVVEDDPLVRELTVGYLSELGYKTLNAENAVAALTVLDTEGAVDLVVSDVVMPGGMSGLDLSCAIRERFEDIRILHMSGYSHDEFDKEGHSIDDYTVLQKPFNKEQLASKVRETLDT